MSTIEKHNLINYFFALLPLSLIIGNLAININVIVICFLGLFYFGKKIFYLENKKYQYLIYFFFFFLIFTTYANNFQDLNNNPLYKINLIKSLFFLKFLLFFLVINKCIELNALNIKLFYLSCSFLALLLSIDIIIQVIFGKDILGYPITENRPSGFFGDENIAGGYLQKFILFFIFFFVAKFIKYKKKFFILLLFLFFSIPILLTGNRMPFVLYVFSAIIYFVFNKNLKSLLLLLLLITSISILFVKFQFIKTFENQMKNFKSEIIMIINHAPKLFFYDNYNSPEINFRTGYLIHFNTGVQIWKNNKIIGNGLKSMQLKCSYKNNQTCNTHPHNYFIEIMMDTGIVGVILIYSIFISALYNFLKYYFSNNNIGTFLFFPFFLIIFFEFFPLRSSGSFFTTHNGTIIFIMLAIFINYKKVIKFFLNHKI
jgi:O-antigen ligase